MVKQCVEDYRTLRISTFALKPDYTGSGVSYWGKGTDNEASMGYSVDTRDKDESFIKFSYTLNRKEKREHRIRLSVSYPHIGGVRYWFLCPCCMNRKGVLYFSGGVFGFSCRTCLNLTYRTSQATKLDRLNIKRRKIEKSMGGDCYHKPKGMHHKTFFKRQMARIRTQERIQQEYNRIVFSMAGRFSSWKDLLEDITP